MESEMESPHPTRIQQLLTPLRESITNKPPYICGTLPLPAFCFSLFYKITEDGSDARHINLANATSEELDQLAEACETTSSDANKKGMKKPMADVLAKMDLGSFALLLEPAHANLVNVIRGYHFEGDKSNQRLKVDLRELNVYSKGSFSKPRVEAPPDKSMFGSLVIIFPTPHEGGAVSLKSRTSHHEQSFDHRPETSTHKLSIGYVVLLKDVEYEVAPVTSGHRVTLTYDLYAEEYGRHDTILTTAQQALDSKSIPPLINDRPFRDEFMTLLENGEFLADGGTLAFGLANRYSFKSPKHVSGDLEGSDAVVYRTLRGLGFEPVLRMYYQEWDQDWIGESLEASGLGVVYDKIPDLPDWTFQDDDPESIIEFIKWTHGQFVRQEDFCQDFQGEPEFDYEDAELVAWVTPLTTFNRKESVFEFSTSEMINSSATVVYGDLCLFVRIGKAGERLSYPRG